MKIFRKTLHLLLVLALVVGLLPTPFGETATVLAAITPSGPTSGSCPSPDGEITWELTPDQVPGWDSSHGTPYKLTITGHGQIKNTVVPSLIPWYNYHSIITSVSISEGITSINDDAFNGCEYLKTITLPDSVAVIGERAFMGCSLLETVVCGSGLKEIKVFAFYNNTSLTAIQFKEGLETIGPSAFSGCSSLDTVSLPDSLLTLDSDCFTSLKEVTIPKNVTTIGAGILTGSHLQSICVAEGNTHFRVLDNVLYEMGENNLPYRAIAFCGSPTEIIIPNGTEIIDSSAFAGANAVASVTLPETVKAINNRAFYGLSKLKELNIPDSVETIKTQAFGYCTSLQTITIGSGLQTVVDDTFFVCDSLSSVTISEENPYLDSIDSVVYSKDHTHLYYYPPAKIGTVYHVLNTVETMSKNCIYRVSSLKELYLPKTLTSIPDRGIANNSRLNSIYFPADAPKLDYYAIRDNADNLVIYRSPSTSGWDENKWASFTFADWEPDNTFQEEGSFEGITWKYEGDKGRITFSGTGTLPNFTKEAPAPWDLYIDSIQTIETGNVSGIGNYSFYHADKLIRLETGSDLHTIGNYAFAYCKDLKFIGIATAETIGTGAFFSDNAITGNLTLEKVSSIAAKAFQDCSSIEDATLGSRLSSLEEKVFAGCAALNNLIIPQHTSAIKTGALSGCSSLRTINIPTAVNTIESQAFAGAASLEKVYFYGDIPELWAEDSFTGCNENLTLCYRKTQESWNTLNGSWNTLPLLGLERFYTEQQDHYSFDNNTASFGYAPDYRIPKYRYLEVLDSISAACYYYAINRSWLGSCYGMAATTLEFYENTDQFQITDYDASAGSLYALTAPGNKDAALTKLIESYQISQFKTALSGCSGSVSKSMKRYRTLIQKVEEFERSGGLRVDSGAEPIVMLIYSKYNGHAVIPVSVDQDETGDFLLKVYDPNYPSTLQTLTVKKDFSRISYEDDIYSYASYIDYNAIANAMSGIQLHETIEDDSLYLSIDKANATITNEAGKDIDNIEGAYEQKPLAGNHTDAFSGIRSFVLPEGNYKILTEETTDKEQSLETENSVTFYMASPECFAEIISSDENAALEVKESNTETGKLELSLQSESIEKEDTSFTLVNAQGMERTIEIEGASATVAIKEDTSFSIQVPSDQSVTIDGKEAEITDGQANGSFAASLGENPLKADYLETSVNCDTQNKLDGTINASIISNLSSEDEVDMTADYLDEKGNTVASYTEKTSLKPGLNIIHSSFESLTATFEATKGDIALSCRLTVTDKNGNSVVANAKGFTVSLTEKPNTPDPDAPKDPDDPGNNPDDPKDPDDPGNNPDDPKDPDDPGNNPDDPKDPDDPGNNPDNPPEDPDIEVTNVCVSKEKITLGVGETFQLNASVIPKNASDKTLTFTASNSSVSVTQKGMVTAKKTGTSTITIKSSNGKYADVAVTVKKSPSKIILNSKKLQLGVGKTFQIKATFPKNEACNNITYSSSKKSVATVSSTGKVTARKKGSSIITVKSYNGKNGKLKITVTANIPVKKVNVSTKKLLLGIRESCQLNASVSPKNASNKKLSYKSSNSTIKVSSKGKVTAKKTGTSKITIKSSNGKKASVMVSVRKAPKKITLNVTKKTLKVGKKFQIKVKLPKGTASHKIKYSISKKSIATVSSTGKITARKKGTATITVQTYNKKKATLRLTVK